MPTYRDYVIAAQVSKFGHLPDIDATDTDEDVWSATGVYPGFVDAAATTSVVSSSADDDTGGTGALSVRVQGLVVSGSDWVEVSEDADLSGVTPVNLSNQFIRIYRAYVLTAGTGETNAGTIQVKHGATVLADMEPGEGQTQQAIYTVPDQVGGVTISGAAIIRWYASAGGVGASVGTVALQVKEPGGAWRTRRIRGVSEGHDFDEDQPFGIQIKPKSDIRVRVLTNGVNNTQYSAGFDVVMW